MILSVKLAMEIIPILLDIGLKALDVIRTKKPENIEEEMARLEKCKLRPSAEIIAEADTASKR